MTAMEIADLPVITVVKTQNHSAMSNSNLTDSDPIQITVLMTKIAAQIRQLRNSFLYSMLTVANHRL